MTREVVLLDQATCEVKQEVFWMPLSGLEVWSFETALNELSMSFPQMAGLALCLALESMVSNQCFHSSIIFGKNPQFLLAYS